MDQDEAWISWLTERFGPDRQRDRSLRTLAIDRRNPRRAPTPDELREAREAQKWANHIHDRELARTRLERREDDNTRDAERLDELPAWTSEQSERLRYIARTGQLPSPRKDLTDAERELAKGEPKP